MDRTGPKIGFRSPEGKKVSKMDRTGPKMGFRSPDGGKKCQNWIEQAQKLVLGARRVEKSDKNG